MLSLYFNELDTYMDLGLKIIKRPNIPTPQKNINVIEIEGRNGSLIEDIGTYKDIEISVSFNFVDTTNINQKIRRIKEWLIGRIKDNYLMFTDDTEVFYKVKYIKIDDIERAFKILGRFNVTFVCDPFAYLINGDNVITITKDTILYNLGTFYSEPTFKIYGNGKISLTINNSNIILENIVGFIEINSELQSAYKDTVNENSKMFGEFPVLIPGENHITWIGNISKIEITPRWRFL